MSDSKHPFNRPEFKLKKAPRKKLILIGVVSVFVLVVASGATYTFRDQLFSNPDSSSTSNEQAGDLDQAELTKSTNIANTYIASGNIEAAALSYDDAIKNTDSQDQKSALYLNKALALGTTDTPAAIKAAEESTALNPSFENTAYLAMLYERNGDIQKAIDTYEKTVVLYKQLGSTEEGGPTHVSTYEDRIKRLKAQ